jgi:Gamma-glutamyl cyclotransferase, AIG2-like
MVPERTVSLFSYGTLQLVSVQTVLFGRILEGRPDSMPGYRQTMIELTDPDVIAKSGTASHPIVVHTGDPTDRIEGAVFLITEDELAAADTYEVSGYTRIQVSLQSGTDAWVYVAA